MNYVGYIVVSILAQVSEIDSISSCAYCYILCCDVVPIDITCDFLC
jgi:hypothetical protein